MYDTIRNTIMEELDNPFGGGGGVEEFFSTLDENRLCFRV